MNQARKSRSRQSIIRQKKQRLFIGRKAQIEAFRTNLKQSPNDWYFPFSIWGPSGVGKSTLVKQFRKIAEEEKFITAFTDHSEDSILEVMKRSSEMISNQGFKLNRFNERYKVYLQKKEELEADPEAPHGLSAFLGKSIAKAGFSLAKQVPVGSTVTSFIDEEAVAKQIGEWTAFVTKKIRNKDEIILINRPVEVLSKLFLEDLKDIAENNNIALFFDSYERTSIFMDAWIREILLDPEARYGEFPGNLILIISGSQELCKHDWKDYKEVMVRWCLEPFTETEIRQYLARRKIDDPQVVDRIVRLSEGLPLWVETLVSENKDETIYGNASNTNAVDLFLKGIEDPNKKRIALEASLSPLLNKDIIGVLNNDEKDTEELCLWLQSLPFIEKEDESFSYHNIVRNQMLLKQRLASPKRWTDLHSKLADYNSWRWKTLQINEQTKWYNSSWETYFLNSLYHRICGSPSQGLIETLSSFLSSLEQQSSSESAQKCADVAVLAGKSSGMPEVIDLGNQLSDGLKAFNENRYKDGIEMLTLLLCQYNLEENSRAIALSWRGEAYRLIGKCNKSLQDFDSAISINSNESWVIVSRSSTYRKIRKYEESLVDCNKAIELDETDIRAFTSRGETYLRLRRYEEALKDFDYAIELDPSDSWSISSRGKAYQQMRLYDKALQDFDQAISLSPDDSWSLSNRAFIHRKQGNYEQALVDYDNAIKIDSRNARFFASRAETYRLMGRCNQALEDFSHALSLKPNEPWALCRRAETYLLVKDYNKSLSDFQKVVALSPNNDWRLFTYSLALKASGKLQEASIQILNAIQIAERRYEQNLEDYRTALTLALYNLSNDDEVKAIELYEVAISNCKKPALIWEAIRGLDDFLNIFSNHFFAISMRQKLLEKVE